MKIRLILLSLLGVAIYIMLANYNSKMIKDNPAPREQDRVSVPQSHPGKSSIAQEKATQQTGPVAVPAPSAPLAQQPEAAPQKPTESAPVELTVQSQAVGTQELQQLQAELARKEEQIRQMLNAQEALAGQYRQLLARSNAVTTETAARDKMLGEANDRITALNADKQRLALELTAAQTAQKQLSSTLEQLKETWAKTEQSLKEKESLFTATQQQIQQQAGETGKIKTQLADTLTQLQAAQTNLEKAQQQLQMQSETTHSLKAQLTEAFAQTQTAKTDLEKARQTGQEKEDLFKAAQVQIQQQSGESESLKAQLAEATAQAQTTKNDLEKVLQTLKEKENLFNAAQAQLQQQAGESESLKAQLAEAIAQRESVKAAAEQQRAAQEKALEEKTAALTAATFTIQALKQEVASQPQAVATIQNLLDERNQELEQVKNETAAQIQQLRQQVTDLGTNGAQAAADASKYKTEAEAAQKRIVELESAQALAQAAVQEAEKKMTAALDSKNTLQNQLNDKEAVISGSQAQANELLAKITSLDDEKIGLTSQLTALQAELKNMEEIKATFAKQSADLADAETRLKELAALQLKNGELTKSVEEKTAALAEAAKQGEELTALQTKHSELTAQLDANATTIKQMEAEKADLAAQLAAAQAQAQEVEALKKTLEEKTAALGLAESKIKELANAEEQIADLRKKLTDHTVALQELQTAKQATEQKIIESESALKSQGQTLTASNEKTKTLETELAAAQERIKELMDKHHLQQQQDLIPNLNQQIATLRDQVAQMETASAQVKKNKDEADAAIQAKAEEAKAAENKLQILQTEKDGLVQSLHASQASIASLQKQLDELKGQPQAPGLPAEKLTDTEAVTQDHDKDGLADDADLCPNSPAGAPINALGCPAKGGIILDGVTFKSNTAIFLANAPKTLDKVAASLRQLPQVKVEIAGYTDSVGDPGRNLELSLLRSQAVVKYLVDKGVAAGQLTAKGYGPENPIADNATSAGKQKNRRVELHPIAP